MVSPTEGWFQLSAAQCMVVSIEQAAAGTFLMPMIRVDEFCCCLFMYRAFFDFCRNKSVAFLKTTKMF